MCDQRSQYANALISSRDQGTILMILAWVSTCLIILCTVARITARYRLRISCYLASSDDGIIFIASACALGSTLVTTTAVNSGLGKRKCLLDSTDLDQIQTKIFAATILFVLAISIAKCSLLTFLHRLADRTPQRACTIAIGSLVLLWTITVVSGTIFQCETPQPWTIWTGKCIPLASFWTTAIIADLVMETAMVILSLQIVWTLRIQHRQKVLASLLLSPRLLLIAASILRIIFIRHAFASTSDPTFSYLPYALTTQIHTTLATILPCALILSPMRALFHSSYSLFTTPKPHPLHPHRKHWSDTTISTPNSSHATLSHPEITREPLPSIQASMSIPASPVVSRHSLADGILLPDVQLPMRIANPPPRPPRPSEAQRPDLTMFTKTTCLREPPLVTKLGSMRGGGRGGVVGWRGTESESL